MKQGSPGLKTRDFSTTRQNSAHPTDNLHVQAAKKLSHEKGKKLLPKGKKLRPQGQKISKYKSYFQVENAAFFWGKRFIPCG